MHEPGRWDEAKGVPCRQVEVLRRPPLAAEGGVQWDRAPSPILEPRGWEVRVGLQPLEEEGEAGEASHSLRWPRKPQEDPRICGGGSGQWGRTGPAWEGALFWGVVASSEPGESR